MTLKELIAKGEIDTSDDIQFANHSEVMRLFGNDHINSRISFYQHPHEPGVHIWFPVFYQDDDNAWENTWGQNELNAFERRKVKNEEYLNEQFDAPERHIRIMFAKIAPYGRVFYKFKGIFQFDPELSRKAKKAAYRRVVTIAKLYPF